MWYVLLLFGTITHETVIEDKVSLIEINHFYDGKGKLVFDQVVFWNWDRRESRYQVVAWRLLNDRSQLPHRDRSIGEYVLVWYDGDSLRKVYAKAMRETYSQYDPELIERDFFPKDKRIGLTKQRRKR